MGFRCGARHLYHICPKSCTVAIIFSLILRGVLERAPVKTGLEESISDTLLVSTQIVVPGTTTTALLQQLLPDTDYNVGVVALYSDGEGPAISDAGKTCELMFDPAI